MEKAGHSKSISELLEKASTAWPVARWCNSDVIVGVSGGADSVALLHVLQRQRILAEGSGRTIVLYCHHQTRPECDEELKFVKDLAERLRCQFVCNYKRSVEADDSEADQHQAEDALRSFRYNAFLETAREFGARYVATAHHADDQIETVLFRMFRGTGLAGLAGIPELRTDEHVTFVRPLLGVRKQQIEQFLQELNQDYCIDNSNHDTAYTRNFIRHELLPLIQQRFGPGAENCVLRLAQQARENEQLLNELAEPFCGQAKYQNHSASMPLASLRRQNPLVITAVVRQLWRQLKFSEQDMTEQKWRQIVGGVVAGVDLKLQLPGNVTVVIADDQLIIQPTAPFSRTGDS